MGERRLESLYPVDQERKDFDPAGDRTFPIVSTFLDRGSGREDEVAGGPDEPRVHGIDEHEVQVVVTSMYKRVAASAGRSAS